MIQCLAEFLSHTKHFRKVDIVIICKRRRWSLKKLTAAGAKSLQSCPTLCDPRPHRRQPTRLRRPWDSPGKNTGVGCHFLLQCMKVKINSEVAQSCLTPSDPMDCSLPGSSIHGIFQARVLEWGAIAFYLGLIGAAFHLCLAGHCRQKRSIWPQEKHFVFVKSFLLRLFFFLFLFLFSFSFLFSLFFSLEWGPTLRRFSARSRLCFKSSFAQKYSPYLFQP